jgi:hypothetical protein
MEQTIVWISHQLITINTKAKRLRNLMLDENTKLQAQLNDAEQSRKVTADENTALWAQFEEMKLSKKANDDELKQLRHDLKASRRELKKSREEQGIKRRDQREENEQMESHIAQLERDLGNARTELTGLKSRRKFEDGIYKNKCDTLEKELKRERAKIAVNNGHVERIERLERSLEQARERVGEYEATADRVNAEAGAEAAPETDMFDVVSDIKDDREGWLQAIERLLKQRDAEASRVRNVLLAKDMERTRIKRFKTATETALSKEKEKHKSTKADLAALKKKLESCENMESWIRTLTGPTPTPRSILVTTISITATEKAVTTDSPADPIIPEHFSVKDLHPSMFDVPLIQNDVYNFLNGVSRELSITTVLDSLKLEFCSICEEQKFVVRSSHEEGMLHLNEFSPHFGLTKCCNRSICTACYSTSFRSAIKNDWWHNLESDEWLRCSVESCKQPMGITSSDQLTARIHELEDIDIDTAVQM